MEGVMIEHTVRHKEHSHPAMGKMSCLAVCLSLQETLSRFMPEQGIRLIICMSAI